MTTSTDLRRLRQLAARGDQDAVEALRRHAARSGSEASDTYVEAVRPQAAAEIARRTGAGAVRRQETESYDVALLVAAELRAKGVEASVKDGSRFVTISSGDLFCLSAAGIVAPVAPDGSELMARFDKGPWTSTTDEQGRRRPEWAEPVWAILRPSLGNMLTPAKAAELEETKVCPHCGRKEGLGYRRYLFVIRKTDGEFVALGSTCAADLLGVKAEQLFPNAEINRGTGRILRELCSQARDEVKRQQAEAARLAGIERLNVALGNRNAARYGSNGYHLILTALEDKLEELGVEDGELLNYRNSLVRSPGAFAFGARISYRGRRLAEWYERGATDATVEPEPTPALEGNEGPEFVADERGTWAGRVTRVKQFNGNRNRYKMPYQGVSMRLADGRRVWFPVKQGRDVREGDRLTVSAKVTAVKGRLAFLGFVARVEGLRPDVGAAGETLQG